jgi:hypothetical protein
MPERVDHLVALSVGHLTSFANAGFEQLEKSWYMLLFQFQDLAEEWLSKDGWANFRAWAQHPDAEHIIEELEAPEALTPALNWYRANLPPERFVAPAPKLPTVSLTQLEGRLSLFTGVLRAASLEKRLPMITSRKMYSKCADLVNSRRTAYCLAR